MPEGNNELYTPEFLRQHIGRLVRVEFLIGTNFLEDRIGIIIRAGKKSGCMLNKDWLGSEMVA